MSTQATGSTGSKFPTVPLVWHIGTEEWLYVTEPAATANQGWIYIFELTTGLPNLWIIMQGESDWAYSYGLSKWLYVDPSGSGWVYML